MITIKGNGGIYEGNSTDTKPSDVAVNTIFHELDTNCKYYFTGEDWAEIPSSGGGGGGGTDNYNELSNKPSINSVTLSGNKTAANLGLQAEITGDVTISSDNVDDTGATNLFVTSSEKSTWNGKQDALTIDSEPTESSTNPVQSGGVYTALSGKQATLAFDGTYSATTNKVATESTVSGAISALDKSSVGLDNVTNNAQVKAVSGSVTSGDIVTFGADGATVQDSGKAIETSLSDSDDKVPTSKAVRDNVAANATLASGYTADTSEASITSATKINDAIEQLDYRTTTNKTNILSSYGGVVGKNKLNVNLSNLKSYNNGGGSGYSWSGNVCTTTKGVTFTVNADSSISVVATATSADIWFKLFNGFVYTGGVSYVLSGCPTGGSTASYFIESDDLNARDTGNTATILQNSNYTDSIYICIKSGTTFTGTFKPMICTQTDYTADPTYQPYVLSNVELTAKEQQNENNITSILAREIRKVYVSKNMSSTAHTYKMTFDDFQSPNDSVGTYLIAIVTWNASPSFKLYAVSFSGANLDYTTVSPIYGEQTITVDSEHNINLTTSGKVTIYALR